MGSHLHARVLSRRSRGGPGASTSPRRSNCRPRRVRIDGVRAAAGRTAAVEPIGPTGRGSAETPATRRGGPAAQGGPCTIGSACACRQLPDRRPRPAPPAEPAQVRAGCRMFRPSHADPVAAPAAVVEQRHQRLARRAEWPGGPWPPGRDLPVAHRRGSGPVSSPMRPRSPPESASRPGGAAQRALAIAAGTAAGVGQPVAAAGSGYGASVPIRAALLIAASSQPQGPGRNPRRAAGHAAPRTHARGPGRAGAAFRRPPGADPHSDQLAHRTPEAYRAPLRSSPARGLEGLITSPVRVHSSSRPGPAPHPPRRSRLLAPDGGSPSPDALRRLSPRTGQPT